MTVMINTEYCSFITRSIDPDIRLLSAGETALEEERISGVGDGVGELCC
jgi:hypothetical protein